ncbi:MAG: trypsin-like peptidase domain-containing protein [Planctomycetes bacterium]|nr:trypsin-like peptidase domain-containing protein [Planctomycetota bacterium]
MKMKASVKARVEAATVKLTQLGGRGVLVQGGYILTAAHCIAGCIDWSSDLERISEGYIHVETHDRRKIRVSVCALEPVADIAVLECADDPFLVFAEEVKGIPLYSSTLKYKQSVPVCIFGKDNRWITGEVIQVSPRIVSSVCLKYSGRIKFGDSGSPVVDGDGQLMGVFSRSGSGECGIPLAWWALPRWLTENEQGAVGPRKCPGLWRWLRAAGLQAK